ncbi:hypothetical protein PT286_05820 [Neisseriaceae bacterium ESL0693]|nr:hypothetical protein [Neisseriaceae bacterium ESL0693]
MTDQTQGYKWLFLALIWFGASIYGLFFHHNPTRPPFQHFDKICHFGLFFGQTWLIIKFYLSRSQPIVLLHLMILMTMWALISETILLFLPVHAHFLSDIMLNLLGMIIASALGWRIQKARLSYRSNSA